MNEKEIMKAISNGDEDAFKMLYEATHKKVFLYLFRLFNNKEIAEDITMETYIEVWNSADKFRGNSKVVTWIIGIARNIAITSMRNLNKESIIEQDITTNACQFQAFSQKEISSIVYDVLNKLSLKHREILTLVFFDEMKYEDIACVLNISINTVKTRVFYAKEKFIEVLHKMGVRKEDVF